MNKVKSANINFDDDDFVIEYNNDKQDRHKVISQKDTILSEQENIIKEAYKKASLIINQANQKSEEIIFKANSRANKIKEKATKEAEELIEKIKNETTQQANQEANELIEKTKQELEEERIEVTKKGYEDGYNDGLLHIKEEQEENINLLNQFCASQNKIKETTLEEIREDILLVISNISKKILLKEIDKDSLDKIIKKTIALLKEKKDITIVVSEKYAKMLLELQNKNQEEKISFENFTQYENFKIIFNSKFNNDTIIIENNKVRLESSLNSQLDIIIQEIYNKTNDDKIDIEIQQD